jgi:ribonuclease HI
LKIKKPNTSVLVISDSYVVDSVEKKWFRLGKGFVDRKNADLWKRF